MPGRNLTNTIFISFSLYAHRKSNTPRKKSATSCRKSTNQVQKVAHVWQQKYHFVKTYQLSRKFRSKSTRKSEFNSATLVMIFCVSVKFCFATYKIVLDLLYEKLCIELLCNFISSC